MESQDVQGLQQVRTFIGKSGLICVQYALNSFSQTSPSAQNAYGYTPISFKNDVCPEVQKPVFEQNTQVQFTPENTPIVNDSVTPEPDSVNTNEVFAYNIQLSESAKRAPA